MKKRIWWVVGSAISYPDRKSFALKVKEVSRYFSRYHFGNADSRIDSVDAYVAKLEWDTLPAEFKE
jgi:hypothetical protein